jgi:hypothetical protein
MAHIEADINSNYIELGKAMYEKVCNDPDSEYASIIADIKEKNCKLDELKAVLMSLEDKMFCVNCGAQIKKDQLFCDKCGAKVENIVTETAETVETEVVEGTAEVEFNSEETNE